MEYKVRHGLDPYCLQGTLLAHVTTERPEKVRWMEMSLYRVNPGGLCKVDKHGSPDGPAQLPAGGYVTYVIGQSIVAHGRDSACGEGVPVPITALPLDAQPCPECKPDFPHHGLALTGQALSRGERRVTQERQGLTGLVDLEVTRHTIYPVPTAREVYDGMTRRKMSVPAERCLRIAALTDNGIAEVMAAQDIAAGGAA